MHDVAADAGVSVATVSRVVNRKGTVRDATRRRVEHAIRDLGYTPNLHARELVLGNSQPLDGPSSDGQP